MNILLGNQLRYWQGYLLFHSIKPGGTLLFTSLQRNCDFFFLITELDSNPQVSHYWYWCFCFLGGTLARLLYFATGNNTSIKPLCLGLHLRTQKIWREIALKDPNSTRSNSETLGEWPLFGDAGTISGCRGNQDSRKLLLSPPERKVGPMEPRNGVHRSCEHSIQG